MEALREQYRAHPSWSAQLHHENLAARVQADPALGPMPSYATLTRAMRNRGLVRKRRRRRRGDGDTAPPASAREVLSYEVSRSHALWHTDFHRGKRRVLIPSGEWKTPILLGFLDDHSRLGCHLQWYLPAPLPPRRARRGAAVRRRGRRAHRARAPGRYRRGRRYRLRGAGHRRHRRAHAAAGSSRRPPAAASHRGARAPPPAGARPPGAAARRGRERGRGNRPDPGVPARDPAPPRHRRGARAPRAEGRCGAAGPGAARQFRAARLGRLQPLPQAPAQAHPAHRRAPCGARAQRHRDRTHRRRQGARPAPQPGRGRGPRRAAAIARTTAASDPRRSPRAALPASDPRARRHRATTVVAALRTLCRDGRVERARQGGYRLAGDARREPFPEPVSRSNPRAGWETETGNTPPHAGSRDAAPPAAPGTEKHG